jgi:hypothetical protein
VDLTCRCSISPRISDESNQPARMFLRPVNLSMKGRGVLLACPVAVRRGDKKSGEVSQQQETWQQGEQRESIGLWGSRENLSQPQQLPCVTTRPLGFVEKILSSVSLAKFGFLWNLTTNISNNILNLRVCCMLQRVSMLLLSSPWSLDLQCKSSAAAFEPEIGSNKVYLYPQGVKRCKGTVERGQANK